MMKTTGQTSVLGGDQPLHAIIKLIQWQYPATLEEDEVVAMMDGLHIDNETHAMIGKLLFGSGWVTILYQAGLLTSDYAQSILNEHHIKETRYAHQFSLSRL